MRLLPKLLNVQTPPVRHLATSNPGCGQYASRTILSGSKLSKSLKIYRTAEQPFKRKPMGIYGHSSVTSTHIRAQDSPVDGGISLLFAALKHGRRQHPDKLILVLISFN